MKEKIINRENFSVLKGEIVDAPRVLVLDDDPILIKSISRLAKKHKIPMTAIGSIEELKKLEDSEPFDVALIDYYLDDIRGTDVAAALGATPVVMMSAQSAECLEDNEEWPATVRKFVNKDAGIEHALTMALQVGHTNRELK